MQVTLKSIAAATGFSVTTVSRALGGYDDVNVKTRQIILETAQRLGYRPNQIARQLRSQNTHTLGIIIPASNAGLDDDFFSLLLKGITHTAALRRFDVLVSTHWPDEDELEAYYRIVGGNRVDGMILARTHRNDSRIRYLRQIKHPFVVSGRSAPENPSDFPFIDVDSQQGLRELVHHFVALGHQRIGLVLSPPEMAFTPYRLAGFRLGLAEAELPFNDTMIVSGDLSREGGKEAAAALLTRHPDLTALIACNDMMAIGAYDAIRQIGRVVGQDVAVGGFDDIPLAAHVVPALTTVRQPIYDIGEQLTQMLIEIIADDPPEEQHKLLKPTLIVRDSSGSQI